MRAACMTREFDWALDVTHGFWREYEKSPIRQNAYFASLLRTARARLLLNQHAVNRAAGHPEKLVREDLDWLSSKAPQPCRAPASARIKARLALLRGDRSAAIELFRASAEHHAVFGAHDEVARERYVLGHLLEEGEGAMLQVSALNALRESGILEPAQDLRGYYPELFPDTAKP
jgi:hypothetical protein